MNAIYELVTRDSRGPSAAVAYRVGVALGLLVTAYLSYETLYRWPSHPTVGAWVYGWAALFLTLLPAIVSAVSAIVTAQHARRVDFALLQTTPLSKLQIAWGFFRGALYHCRLIIALGVPLMPIVAIGALQHQVEIQYYYFTTCNPFPSSACVSEFPIYAERPGFDSPSFISSTITLGEVGVALWVSALAGVSIGVYFGLRNHSAVLAPMASIAVTLLCLLLPALWGLGVMGPFIEYQLVLYVPVLNVVGLFSFFAARELTVKHLVRQTG